MIDIGLNQIDQEMIGEDYETTVQAYLQRDIKFNLESKKIIIDALKKLGYDGVRITFYGNNMNVDAYELNNNQIQVILDQNDTESFYRSLPLEALNYLGY